MKNKKIIPIILVSISIFLFIIAIILLLNTNYLSNSNKNYNKDSKTNKVEEIENSTKNENNTNTENKEEINSNTETKIESENNTNTETKEEPNNKKEETTNIETTKYTEEDVITYFSNREKEIGTNQEDKSLREKVKESFISIIDFIFYDKEIKGYTFDELTTSAKLKVIEIALSIDNKIDEYFPDYKETIKDKYTNIKGKLAVKYLEFTENLCNNVGTDVCNQAKEDFNTMKESFGFTWELIKELAKSGSSKLKEFYESWKDSE